MSINNLCNRLQSEADEYNKEIETLTKELELAKNENNQIKTDLSKKITEFQTSTIDLQKTIDIQQSDLIKNETNIDNLNKQLVQLDTLLCESKSELDKIYQNNQKLLVDTQRVYKENHDLNVKIGDNIEETNRIVGLKNELEKKYSILEANYEKLSKNSNKLEGIQNQHLIEINKLKDQLTNEKRKNAHLETVNYKLKNNKDQLKECVELSEKNKSLQCQLDLKTLEENQFAESSQSKTTQLNQKIKQLEQSNLDLLNSLNEKNRMIDDLKKNVHHNEIDLLEKINKNYSLQNNNRILQAYKKENDEKIKTLNENKQDLEKKLSDFKIHVQHMNNNQTNSQPNSQNQDSINNNLLNEINALKQQLNDSQDLNTEYERTNKELNDKLNQIHNEMNALNQQVNEYQQQKVQFNNVTNCNRILNDDLYTMKTRYEQISKNYQDLLKEKEQFTDLLASNESKYIFSNKFLQNQINLLKNITNKAQQDLNSKQNDLNLIQGAYEECQKNNQDLLSKIKTTENNNTVLKNENAKLVNTLRTSRQQFGIEISNLKNNIKDLENQEILLSNKIDELKTIHQRNEGEVCSLRTNLTNNKQQVKGLEQEIEQYKIILAQKEDAFKQHQDLFHKWKKAVEEKFDKYKNTLESADNNHQQAYAKIQQELQTEKNKHQQECARLQQDLQDARNDYDNLVNNNMLDGVQFQNAKKTIESLKIKLKDNEESNRTLKKQIDDLKNKYKNRSKKFCSKIDLNESEDGDEDSMDFESCDDDNNFYLLDGKNPLFQINQIKNKKNPLSACPLYNCPGKNNTGFHRCSNSCPKIKKETKYLQKISKYTIESQGSMEPKKVIFETIKDIPDDFASFEHNQILVCFFLIITI